MDPVTKVCSAWIKRLIFRANRRSRAKNVAKTGTSSPAFLIVALMDTLSYIYAQVSLMTNFLVALTFPAFLIFFAGLI